MNIRISFAKYGTMKYLGHLDLMRYFQKALRRAKFPLEFSKGFHPHPVMSFAQPLSVGVTSACEYFDVSLKEDIDVKDYKDALQNVMEEGVDIVDIEILPEKSKNAMSLVSAAEYIVYFKEENPGITRDALESYISNFMSQDEILYTKKTKKNEITKDIKPFIYEIKPVEIPQNSYGLTEGTGFFLHIKSGSEDNLTPLPIVQMILKNAGIEFADTDFGVHREKIILKNA